MLSRVVLAMVFLLTWSATHVNGQNAPDPWQCFYKCGESEVSCMDKCPGMVLSLTPDPDACFTQCENSFLKCIQSCKGSSIPHPKMMP
ncbi:hypothetical protein I3760_06G111800 [Carya illinoinensis]|nr:hypothetical protein I3760_06G111800 [Carya illinoinensis]